jgi:hypothetical protein
MNHTKKQKYTTPSTIRKINSDSHAPAETLASVPLKRTVSVADDRGPTPSAASQGILLTTTDAYTLTDGPTIFLCEDVNKIGKFYIQQTNIPTSVFQGIMAKITRNSDIINQIEDLEKVIQAKETKTTLDTSKVSSGGRTKEVEVKSEKLSNESKEMVDKINKLRKEIRLVSLDSMYVPNTKAHQQIWAPNGEIRDNAFASHIGEDMAKTIMLLNIDNSLKVLLLLGIGMLLDKSNVQYMEIMKQLANDQKLFIIIASTDYIYGTNYQFCHGFIGKDLTNMTQQKTLQAMGRIGRNNIQQDYTVRFRDDDMIMKLFEEPTVNMEATNMCKILSCYE